MENSSATKERKWLEISVILACLAILVPIFVIAQYDRPCADDYDYAILTHEAVKAGKGLFGVLKAAWEMDVRFYNSWQGLYSSAFLLSLQPGIFGEKYYALSAAIVMIFAYVNLFFSCFILNKYYVKRSLWFVLASSLFLLTFLFEWLPDRTQGIFWYNGAMNYMPWAFSNLLVLCLFIPVCRTDRKMTRILLLICCTALSFLTSGGNHVTAFANILMLLFAIVYIAVKEKKWYPVLPFAAACIGFYIMYKAPGTAVRQQAFRNPAISETIKASFFEILSLAGEWFSVIWLLAMVFTTPVFIDIARREPAEKKVCFPILPILVFGAVLCGMLCVPYMAMGSFGAGRLLNVIWITFMFFSWTEYYLIIRWIVKRGIIKKLPSFPGAKVIRPVLYLVLCLGMVVLMQNDRNCTSMRALLEMENGIPQKYCREMDKRIALYNDESLDYVAVPGIRAYNTMLFFSDLGPDPEEWPNTSIGQYYHKTIVRID